MAGINAQLFPSRGVRVRKEDIPDFPKCEIRAELLDLGEGAALDALYAEMAKQISALRLHANTHDKSPEHPLTKILRLSEEIELLKVPLMLERRERYRAAGLSVAMFVNFRRTIEAISEKTGIKNIIDGSPAGVRYRDDVMHRFQTNHIRDIILNIDAGGVSISLHDRVGDCPRVGLGMPCFSATKFRQYVGRLPRHGGKSDSFYEILFAAGSKVDKAKHRALTLKLGNLDALTDADLTGENLVLS